MKIQVIRPNVEKYRIRMERGDKDYRKCMWADILIDHDAYSITAQTDCGDFSHRWPATPQTESFHALCLRMLGDEDYMLGKFSARTEFSLEESKLLFIDLNREDEERIQAVQRMKDCDEKEFVRQLEALGAEEAWEYIVREYPTEAVTFVRLLRKVVLPEMQKRSCTAKPNQPEGNGTDKDKNRETAPSAFLFEMRNHTV